MKLGWISAVVATALLACAQEPVRVENRATADYGRDQLHQAIAAFVKAGRTPAAYAALAARARALLPTMDKTVADEAELKLMVLALAPTSALRERSRDEQIAALALTVWPTAFGERLRPPALSRGALVDERDILPTSAETPAQYILRVCGGALSQVCRDAVPEQQGALLAAHAVHRFNERLRSAVADCLVCGTDSAWRTAIRGWEELDTENNTWIRDVAKAGAPSNWPVAGPGSQDDVVLPEVELSPLGEIVIGGQVIAPSQLDAALRELTRTHEEVALFVRPDISLGRLREIARAIHAAGAKTIALVAREPAYPWRRRTYRTAIGKGRRVDVRPTDSLQVVLRQIDAAGPGVTRLD